MTRTVRWMAAAAAVVAFAGLQSATADDKSNTTGVKWAKGRIETMLTQVTEAAMTRDGMDKLASRFVDADRDRIKPWINDSAHRADLDKLNAVIAQIQGDWKAKYGKDFDIKNDEAVWAVPEQFNLALGEIGRDAELAGMKMPSGADTNKDKNLEKGRNVGYLTVANLHGMPEMKVPLIHEMPDMWKIDVPENVDGQTLYQCLLSHLTEWEKAKDRWPADVNEGYRAMGHHVLMAMMGFGPDAKGPIHVEFGAKSGGEHMDRAKDQPAENK